MANKSIDIAFEKLRSVSQKKGFLLFDDIEKESKNLSINELDWLSSRLLASGIKILDHASDSIDENQKEKAIKEKAYPTNTLLFLNYKKLNATGRNLSTKGFIVYKGSEYNDYTTSSCGVAIEKKRHQLMKSGIMKDGKVTEDIQFGSPSTAAKVLIGSSVNGKILWVNSDGVTLKQLLDDN